jgi:hypothetical protein
MMWSQESKEALLFWKKEAKNFWIRLTAAMRSAAYR